MLIRQGSHDERHDLSTYSSHQFQSRTRLVINFAMRAAILSAALVAAAFLLFALDRAPSPPDQALSSNEGNTVEDDRQPVQAQEPLSAVPPLTSRRTPEGITTGPANASTDSVTGDTPTTLDACPSCQAMAVEISELKKKLANAEARANELSFAALQFAYPEGTPIGDAVRQPEFTSLDAVNQRVFVDLMARHFPIRLTPSEVAWIVDGIKRTGDAQPKFNIVDACIQFLGGRRILEEVARSADSSQTQKFDKDYVEYLSGLK